MISHVRSIKKVHGGDTVGTSPSSVQVVPTYHHSNGIGDIPKALDYQSVTTSRTRDTIIQFADDNCGEDQGVQPGGARWMVSLSDCSMHSASGVQFYSQGQPRAP